MGCLAAPFKFAGCLGMLAALFIGWMYRDRLTSEARRVFGSFGGTEAPASAGRPGSYGWTAVRSPSGSEIVAAT